MVELDAGVEYDDGDVVILETVDLAGIRRARGDELTRRMNDRREGDLDGIAIKGAGVAMRRCHDHGRRDERPRAQLVRAERRHNIGVAGVSGSTDHPECTAAENERRQGAVHRYGLSRPHDPKTPFPRRSGLIVGDDEPSRK